MAALPSSSTAYSTHDLTHGPCTQCLWLPSVGAPSISIYNILGCLLQLNVSSSQLHPQPSEKLLLHYWSAKALWHLESSLRDTLTPAVARLQSKHCPDSARICRQLRMQPGPLEPQTQWFLSPWLAEPWKLFPWWPRLAEMPQSSLCLAPVFPRERLSSGSALLHNELLKDEIGIFPIKVSFLFILVQTVRLLLHGSSL